MENDISKSLLNLYGFKVLSIEGKNPINVRVEYLEPVVCPKCKNTVLRKKDRKCRHIRHIGIGKRAMILILETIKWFCAACELYFWQRFQGVLPRSRHTQAFKEYIADEHHKGITAKDLGKDHGLGHATVTRWYTSYLRLQTMEMKGASLPKVLGIDEHFFTRSKGYATTFCNLKSHKVFDVVLGRSAASLERYLLSCKGRDNVEVAVIDLCEAYRALIKKFLPQARIVADRFHVIRVVNEHFINTWKLLDPKARKSIGLTKLLRCHEWNLSEKGRPKLYRYLDQQPALKPIYEFKQRLVRLLLLKHQTARQLKQLIPQYLADIKDLQESHFEPLVTLGNTLTNWSEEIMCMLRFTKNNGITEGFHNKMEMMSRRAFGFRNFENYRMKVRVACA